MQDDKREYTPPVLELMGTIRSLTRTTEVIGSPGAVDVGGDQTDMDLADTVS